MRARPAGGSVGRFGILAAAIAASVGLLGGGIATATANDQSHPPVSDNEIANLGKTKEYYGDHEVDGEHYASGDSSHAKQVYRIQREAKSYLSAHATTADGAKPALVFDVDDTTLLTYNYELQEDFGYDPETNDEYIQAQKMSAVFGMPELVNWAECTTIEYKSQTRKHLESQGYDIVANFGDQYSDLQGGYGDKRYKIPNPMYYLP